MLCLWLLLLGFALLTLALSDFFHRDRSPGYQKAPPLRRVPRPPDLEFIVDSRDSASEIGGDVAPLKSLQEDQLLVVQSSQGSESLKQNKGNYRILLPGAVKDANAPRSVARGDAGRAVRLHPGEPEKDTKPRYGFNEALSEGTSLRRRLPETRHPG